MSAACVPSWRRRLAGVFVPQADQKNRRRDAGATKTGDLWRVTL